MEGNKWRKEVNEGGKQSDYNLAEGESRNIKIRRRGMINCRENV